MKIVHLNCGIETLPEKDLVTVQFHLHVQLNFLDNCFVIYVLLVDTSYYMYVTL